MSRCARVECRRARPLLGTLVEIAAAGDAAESAIESAFAATAQVGRLMSAHDPASELSELNRRAHSEPVRVHAWTFDVLRLALRLYAESRGAFDCTVGAWHAQAGRLPQRAEALDAGACSADIELEERRTVRFHRKLHVDLGGIAKGYAVDRALEVLRDAGVDWGVVNAGGDLRVFGERAQPVHIRLPEGGLAPLGEVTNAALATSTTAGDPPLGLPIVDPRSGTEAKGDGLVVVLADSCAIADALTKVVALRGPRAEALLQANGAEAFCRDGAGRWSEIPAGAHGHAL